MGNFKDRYSTLDSIDPDLFRDIILGDTDVKETPAGIMNPEPIGGAATEEPSQGFLSKMVSALRGSAEDPQQLADAIVPKSLEAEPVVSEYDSMVPVETFLATDMEELARRSAEKAALLRMESRFTSPVIEEPSLSSSDPMSKEAPTLGSPAVQEDVTIRTQALAEPEVPPVETSLRPKARKIDIQGAGLMSSDVDSSLPNEGVTSKSSLLDFIGKGEGGYDSANRGTISGDIIGSQRVAYRGGKKVSELTVAEIRKYQSITDPNNKERLFTVGKYQTIPSTFNKAVKGLGLSDDTVFTPEIQEKVGMYLIAEKRPKVGKYLRGEGNISTDTAVLELAMEFASIPVPKAIPKGTYGKWPKTDLVAGDSFYKNPLAPKGNKALHTLEETRAILKGSRE